MSGPTFDLIQHLHRQREFSERTFGPGARTAGVIDHIRKELREIEAAPADIGEWIDVVLLALDGAWRSGASPEAIAAALLMKQTRNEARTWPDWRTADPTKAIEHDRSGEEPTPSREPVALPTDAGGCVTKRFVIFTTPGEVPEKKGGWLKDEHLIDFLRAMMLHDDWKPGFRASVLELTWDNDLWASSASEYLLMHDDAIGPRRARKAWEAARAEHERIYKTSPKMKLGDEIDSYRKATAITHSATSLLEHERLFKALRDESWDLRCFGIPTAGGDDFDIGWRVIGHWQAEPCERTVAEVFSDDPVEAVRQAVAALKVGQKGGA